MLGEPGEILELGTEKARVEHTGKLRQPPWETSLNQDELSPAGPCVGVTEGSPKLGDTWSYIWPCAPAGQGMVMLAHLAGDGPFPQRSLPVRVQGGRCSEFFQAAAVAM